jgi:hypothetical protein
MPYDIQMSTLKRKSITDYKATARSYLGTLNRKVITLLHSAKVGRQFTFLVDLPEHLSIAVGQKNQKFSIPRFEST